MSGRFPIKRRGNGQALLNLACGTKMHWEWNNVDFSPYAYLRHHKKAADLARKVGLITPLRQERLEQVDPDIVYWDLRKGIPFEPGSFDAVYHSHFLEHLDRDVGPIVLQQCYHALKPGGVLRVVVPDLQYLTRQYLAAVEERKQSRPQATEKHSRAVDDLIDQMVRSDFSGKAANPLAARIEKFVRGNAAAAGETHRWMYDEYSLRDLLEKIGFRDVRVETCLTSRIADWLSFKLDQNPDGSEYKPESLYMEGLK